MFGRKKHPSSSSSSSDDSPPVSTTPDFHPSKTQIKRATRTRWIWALLTSLCLLITVVFLIVVELGNTQVGRLNNVYFIHLDLANIIPVSAPNSNLINSIAQTLGLHDFYTVGLWNFCEGYNGQGTTDCSPTQTLYWFNPVEILQSELLAGATIALPTRIEEVLSLIRTVSHWMFALFLTGACLSALMMPLVLLSVYTRWNTLFTMLFTFLAALFTTVAAVLATVMFVIMRNAITSATEINIGASIGVEMFVFMWIAAAFAILAWLIQLGQCCCCASRRDVRRGKKWGSKKAWRGGEEMREKERERKDGEEEESSSGA